jgi:hypothetical protein
MHEQMHVHGELTRMQNNTQDIENGVQASSIDGVVWRKSKRSNPYGNCVELAALPGGAVAMRNSRHPDGPALVYTRDEIVAFLGGVKDGDFDTLS